MTGLEQSALERPAGERSTGANDPFGMSRFSLRRYSVQQCALMLLANLMVLAILGWTLTGRDPVLIGLSAFTAAVMAGMTALVVWAGLRTVAVEVWIRRMGMGDLEYRIEPRGRDEISKACLALEALRQSSIRAMQLDLVTQLSRELQEKNDELEDTLRELRRTQDRVISQQKLMELGQLTGAIAHELSNPLNIISNFAGASRELLEEFKEDAEQEGPAGEILDELNRNMRSIESGCGRASRIVQEALKLGQEKENVSESVEINQLVRSHVRTTMDTAPREPGTGDVELREDLDPDAGTLQAMPADLGRVVTQIVQNALEAMGKRAGSEDPGSGYRPVLEVRTRRNGAHVEIVLRDNGTGISPDVIGRIFNPFFTTKPGNRGTGLGLSLTHDIVREHGGEITVESEPGRYTEMTVRIPGRLPSGAGPEGEIRGENPGSPA